MIKHSATRPIFFCDPIVLESIFHCTNENRLINLNNTTGGLKKNGWAAAMTHWNAHTMRQWNRKLWAVARCYSWPGPSKFFSALQSYCSRLSVVLLSCDSRSTLIRLNRRKKNWSRLSLLFHSSLLLLFLFFPKCVFKRFHLKTLAS